MSKDPIASLVLNTGVDVFTGITEHTDLEDVDRAVAGFFKMVVNSLVVTDTSRLENREFASFAKRNPQRKVFITRTQDTEATVRKLVKALCDGPDAVKRNEVLPAVVIHRSPGFLFSDGTDYTDLSRVSELKNSEGDRTYAYVNKSFVKLTYTLKAIAWNEQTLNRLALGMMMWIRHTKQGLKHTFKAKTMLAGVATEVNISIEGRREAALSPEEFEFEQNRVLSLPFTVDVVAEVLEAEQVIQTPISIDIMEADYIE
ncbi:hypothetical protein K6U51_12720 [Vibrio fluvialis]|uniref:hypothetical protein n=1 Tax=Vibrio fluvialis TaxID=676 RepID=UPI001EEA9E6B|nr:hypothetical protein [Vibrio fluvialis]MCG6387509.1 hypothetical protein [Vibrio fluvialis]MCG6418895.1 hypothetical protein [Vibrio fluvialis]